MLKDIDKELETNHILTNHLEMHFLELQKYLSSSSSLKDELDAWFYFLTTKEKMEDIMDMLVKKNPIMKEVYNEYNKFVNTKDLFDNYAEYEKNYFDILALNEERLKGREEGIKETQISMARNMKKDKIDFNTISKYTGLSIQEIDKL